jgi:hypothetical protein
MDQVVAEELKDLLNHKNIKVFLDAYTSRELWGEIVDHLVNLYARKAQYCVLLISKNYPLKTWTETERTSARESALRDAEKYILPLRLDDTNVPGVEEVKGYRDLREHSLETIVNWLEEELRETETRSRPPLQSHDLRSGNVPSTQPAPDDS